MSLPPYGILLCSLRSGFRKQRRRKLLLSLFFRFNLHLYASFESCLFKLLKALTKSRLRRHFWRINHIPKSYWNLESTNVVCHCKATDMFTQEFFFSKSSHDRFLRKCFKLLALKNPPIYQMLIDAIFPLWNIWVKVRSKVSLFSLTNSTRLLNLLSYCHQSWCPFHWS